MSSVELSTLIKGSDQTGPAFQSATREAKSFGLTLDENSRQAVALRARLMGLKEAHDLGKLSTHQFNAATRETIADMRGLAAQAQTTAQAEAFLARSAGAAEASLAGFGRGGAREARRMDSLVLGMGALAAGGEGAAGGVAKVTTALTFLSAGNPELFAIVSGLGLVVAGYEAITKSATDADVAVRAFQHDHLQAIEGRLAGIARERGQLTRQPQGLQGLGRAAAAVALGPVALPFAGPLVAGLGLAGIHDAPATTRLAELQTEEAALRTQLTEFWIKGKDAADRAGDRTGRGTTGGRGGRGDRFGLEGRREAELSRLLEHLPDLTMRSPFPGQGPQEGFAPGGPSAVDAAVMDLAKGPSKAAGAMGRFTRDGAAGLDAMALSTRALSAGMESVIEATSRGGNVLQAFWKSGMGLLGQEFKVKAIGELAEGFAAIFNPIKGGGPGAATHFKAAALYGAAAAAAGVAANAGGGGGSGGGGSSSPGSTPTGGQGAPAGRQQTTIVVVGQSGREMARQIIYDTGRYQNLGGKPAGLNQQITVTLPGSVLYTQG